MGRLRDLFSGKGQNPENVERGTAPLPANMALAGLSLKTERFIIRPLREGDAAALKAVTDDPVVIKAISFLKSPFTLENAEAMIRSNVESTHIFLGVRRSDNEALVGVIGVHPRDSGAIEIGFWIAPISHGNGYASESIGAVIAALGREFPHRLIFAECSPENKASWRVLEKLGFVSTGRYGHRPGRERLELAEKNGKL